MAEPRAYGIQPNFHLDAETALQNIRKPERVGLDFSDLGSPQAVPAQAPAPQPAPAAKSAGGIERIGLDFIESQSKPEGSTPQATPVSLPFKQPEEEGFFKGAAKALFGGAQDTAGSMYSAGATTIGANEAVVDSAKSAAERQKTEAVELGKFKQDLGRRQAAGDDTVWQGVKNVAGAAYDNPEGAFQMVLSQLPNNGVSLASGWAGAEAGIAAGTLVAPGPGTVVGGVAGFLTGLFAANTALEVGGKAQEKARDGQFTDKERGEALTEGVKKGAIITAVDAVTLGGSKWLLGAANRAVETATMRTLQEAGVDTTKVAMSIKEAQKAAFEATATQGRAVSTDAMSKATIGVMEREGLTSAELVSKVQSAQAAAMESVNTLGKKAGRGAAAVGLESVGEGLGEYLGELAATGKASPTEAVMEALSGLSMSLGELHAVAKVEKPGLLTAATNTISKADQTKDPLTTPKTSKGMSSGADALNADLTVLDDRKYMETASYFDKAIKENKDDLLNVMAAIYNQVEQSKTDKAASDEQKQQADQMLGVINAAATRLSLASALANKIKSSSSIESGNEFMSQYPDMRERLLNRMNDLATTLPASSTPKKDNRAPQTVVTPMSEDDVMNAPTPMDDAQTSNTNKPKQTIDLGGIVGASDPVAQMANYIKSISNPEGTAALGGFKEGAVDKYGVVPWVSEDGSTRLFTHNRVPDFVFNSKEDANHAYQALKLANEQMKNRREQKASESLNKNEPPTMEEENSSLDDLDLLYSKDATGVKAVAVPAEKAVYYNAEKLAGMTDKQRKALDLHEIGAHIATELMLGNEKYEALLSELESLKGKDKMVDEAYASLPVNTNPDLVNTEALGYLVENYENMGIVQKFLQMIKDWYAKNFKGQTLTSTDLYRIAREAFATYESQIERKIVKPEDLPSDGLFSKENPTIQDLEKALPAVVRRIRKEHADSQAGVPENQQKKLTPTEVQQIVKQRMAAKPEWEQLAKHATLARVINAEQSNKSDREVLNKDGATKKFTESKRAKNSEYLDTGSDRGLASSEDTSELTAKGTFKKAYTIEAEKVYEMNEAQAVTEKKVKKKDLSKEDSLVRDLTAKLSGIYTQSKSVKWLQQSVDDLVSRLEQNEKALADYYVYKEENDDGSVTVYRRLNEDEEGMESSISRTGRLESASDYFSEDNNAVFTNPETKAALLAERRILQLQLQDAMNDRVSKGARYFKLGIIRIKRTMDFAITSAERAGLSREKADEFRQQWIAPITNYTTYSKKDKAQAQDQAQAELESFLESLKENQSAVVFPDDLQFAQSLSVDLAARKISLSEAINLLDKAAAANEFDKGSEGKAAVIEYLMSEFIDVHNALPDGQAKTNLMNNILVLASKARKEGLMRFDKLKDMFSKQSKDVQREVLKITEPAASRGLTDYMAEHNYEPAFVYYWLRSMDRVVKFNSELLKSQMYTDAERNLYEEYKAQTGKINRKFLALNYTLDQMRNIDELPLNERMRIREFFGDPVDAYFRSIRFAQHHGYSLNSLTESMTAADKQQFIKWLKNEKRKNKQDAERMERQKYFAYISQFKNVGDATLASLHKMIAQDSIANLPIIYDLMPSIERYGFNKMDLDVETGELTKFKSREDVEKELAKVKSGESSTVFKAKPKKKPAVGSEGREVLDSFAKRLSVKPEMIDAVEFSPDDKGTGSLALADVYIKGEATPRQLRTQEISIEMARFAIDMRDNGPQAEASENDIEMFEQGMVSNIMNSLWNPSGRAMTGDASMNKAPFLDFETYRDAVESNTTTFYEDSEQAGVYDEEDIGNMMTEGATLDEVGELAGLSEPKEVEDSEDGEDDLRTRQGQYVGYLNTAYVTKLVNNITKTWKDAPHIVVLQNHMQLPEGIREEVSRKLQKGMGAKGLFDGSTGTIYLFSNFLSSADDVQFTLFHEAYGHLGLRLMFGQEFDQFLNNAYNSSPAVRADVDARLKRGGIGKLEAIEETLSDFAGSNKEPGMVKNFIGRIISGLRKIGLDRVANYIGGFTDAELAYSLKAAKGYAQNFGRSPLMSGPTDLRLSDERPPYEIFAKKGVNTVGYARYDPLTGEYYLFKATGNDIRAGSKMEILKTYEEVVQKMDKMGVLERRVRSGFFRDNKMPSDFVQYLNSKQVGWLQSKLDPIIRSLQNQYLPVFRIVEQMESYQGKNRVTGNLDLRKYLRLNERQTAVKVEDFDRNYVQPIMDLVREAEKTGGQFLTSEGATDIYTMLNKFLLAQTAEERNRQVNKRDPENFAGSGMASSSSVLADPQKHPEDTAKKVLDFVASQPYAKQFEEIGNKLDAMSRQKVKWEVDSGLITPQEGKARLDAYKHYRNLSGINSELDDNYTGDPSLNIGRKFNLRGKDKYATGRQDEAPDILARTLVGAEASIIRGQKNLVAQRLLAFFETNYDPNFISINEQSFRRVVDPTTQFIELRENTNYLNQPDVMVVKVNGRVVTIRFKDTGYNTVNEAIHGKSEPQSEHPFRQIMRIWGRFAGDMITKYNPFWIPVNFVRDVQTLFLNSGVNGEVGWKMAGEMARALPSAMYTTLYAALDEMRPSTDKGKKARDFLKGMLSPNQEMLDHYYKGRSKGAFTSFINHKNLEDQIIEINEAIAGKSTVGKLEGLLKFWEVLTIPVEMAPRLAAYSTMVKNGRAEIDAADYAGSVTVDFNMRGSNEFVRAAYLFFNPAVQGTAQLFKLMTKNPKQFGIVAGGLMTLGFLSTLLVRSLDIDGDEDESKKKARKERGMSALDEVPDYKRATSLILMPNQAFGAIPVAYGWNAFFAAGAFMADSVVGKVPASISAQRTLQAFVEAFVPVGGSGFDLTKVASDPVGQAIALAAPTVAAPMAQWYTNTSRHGGPLYPTGQFSSNAGESDTTKAFASVNPIAKGFAEGLQELTGGDRRNQKGIDLNPALIDHLVQSYMPGIATEMYKGAGVAVRKAQGLDVPREKQPLVDRFSANSQEAFDNSAYHRIDAAVNAAWHEYEKHPSTDKRAKELLQEHPELGKMKDVMRAAESELRKASSQLKKAEDDAYILRKDGQVERADAMDKANVELRNKTEKAKRLVYSRVVTQAAKSGFRDEIYSR
jgi:hypothetical protein